ncbi:MAG TPA: N-acetylglucosamine-6-phosphate deacetylase [Planctomycetaceae bacterium]|nr:N-acetylglucosamine-6-phosphate deacetylase [Blastopirellula sp.]HAY80348.1 N-acetylglucosamine-6-phosphate deacetylase [Planctomycetaceae bacterium]
MDFSARRYDTGAAVRIVIDGPRISSIEPIEDHSETLPYVAPGLVDLQVNGYGGQEFNDLELTVEKVADISCALDRDGVTSYLPTSTTHSFEMLSKMLSVVGQAMEEVPEVSRRAVGIHLEGPYISPEDGPRGAHPREHCRAPDWDEFQRLQEAARGQIKIFTMSPEYEHSAAFIRKAVDSGVLISIGHTAANSEQIAAAVDAGARMSTHLGNGAHGQMRRHPNYIWDQLADDRLTACLIADGHHLPASVVKSFVRAKTPERCILVSDVTGMAGMPPGRYDSTSIGAVEVLDDGRLVVAGQRQYLAGASLPLTVGIGKMMHYADLDLASVMTMATARPLEAIHEAPVELAPQAMADLILFDLPAVPGQPIQIRQTMNQGESVYLAN